MSKDEERTLSRREFLRDSAAAAAALSLGWNAAQAAAGDAPAAAGAAAPAGGSAEPVRYGIIGTGNQGCNDLGQAVKAPDARCVAVCDVYPRNLQRGLKIAPQAEAYSDYRKMLERKDLQAVLIATPLSLHARMACDALDAGKHVFIEKTMAYSVEQCRYIVKHAREKKLHVQVGHQRRYSPLYHHALSQLKEGVIGDVTAIRAFWNRNGSWRRGVPAEDRAQWERLLNWRLYKEYSGGLMAELATHQFDTINWFLGKRPISVMGMAGLDWYKDGRDVWDNVHVIYEYPDGVKVTYESLCTSAYDGEGTIFLGKKGTLILTESGGSLFREPGAEKLAWADLAHTEKDARGHKAVLLDAGATTKSDKREQTAGVALANAADGNQNSYYLELLDFFAVVRHPEQKKPFADASTGLEVAATVLRANDAMEKGGVYRFTKDDFEA